MSAAMDVDSERKPRFEVKKVSREFSSCFSTDALAKSGALGWATNNDDK